MASDLKQTISPALISRVRGIILKPKPEWDIIDGEPASTDHLIRGYLLLLAAIGPICHALGSLIFGYSLLGVTYRPGVLSVIVNAVLSYAFAVGGAYVLAFIINALAPTFDGEKNWGQALKIAVYAPTASLVAGVFGLLPPLIPLALLAGLYSLYVLYLGLPQLMRAPQAKGLAYTAVVIITGIVIGIVIGLVLTPLRLMGGLGMGSAASVGSISSSGLGEAQVQLGGADAALGKLQTASNQLQAQAQAVQAAAASPAGTAAAGPPSGLSQDQLRSLLPASIGALAKGDVESTSAGGAGIGATNAQATYSHGDAKITLEITDMSSAAGLGALAAAINVNSSKETATGYEKVTTVNGRVTTEEYDRSAKHGKYSILASGRLMVEAEGDNVSMDDLKSAVQAVGPDRLDALARHG